MKRLLIYSKSSRVRWIDLKFIEIKFTNFKINTDKFQINIKDLRFQIK